MTPHDRICRILQHERARGRYRASKVTSKMLYAVDFSSRPLDYFMASSDSMHPRALRSVEFDASHWGSKESRPEARISTARQLQGTLYNIQDAANEWYPFHVAQAFSAVHGDSLAHVPQDAISVHVTAMCNLYTAVFAQLFRDIQRRVAADTLATRARRMMDRDSSEYRHCVTEVLDDYFRRERASDTGRRPPPRPQRPGPGPRPNNNSQKIPADLKAMMPKVNGRPVCLRFQTQKDCDFPQCRHLHSLVALPQRLLDWSRTKHGALKAGHPDATGGE
jgi:hypothetical protein